MSDLHPTTCGELIFLGGTYICRLSATPCVMYRGSACMRLRMNAVESEIIKEIVKQFETIEE